MVNRKFWNWLICSLGIHDLRCKQNATQKHCHILDDRLQAIEGLVKVGVDVHTQSGTVLDGEKVNDTGGVEYKPGFIYYGPKRKAIDGSG